MLSLSDELCAAIESSTPLETLQLSPQDATAKPKSALRGEVRSATLNVSDAGAQANKKLRGVAISADGLRLASERPFQESSMAQLEIEAAAAPIKVWVSVVLCAPESAGFCVEVQLFAPSRELRAEWLGMFQRAA